MALATCINNPAGDPLLVLRKWHVDFCEGNKCAAALLSFLIYFHDFKVEKLKDNKKANDIAELHGDERVQDESLYQFHTTEELRERIIGLYSKSAINEGLRLLESKKVITIHRNPNPRYNFDKTKHFLLHPEVCNEWLANKHNVSNELPKMAGPWPENGNRLTGNGQSMCRKVEIDTPESADRFPQTSQRLTENGHAIPKNTNQEQIDIQIDARNNNFSEEVGGVVKLLIEEGMPERYLSRDDDLEAISQILKAGATLKIFQEAIHRAHRSNRDSAFGLYYVLKIVVQILERESLADKTKSARENYKGSNYRRQSNIKVPKYRDLTTRGERVQETAEQREHRLEVSRGYLKSIKEILEKKNLNDIQTGQLQEVTNYE